MKTKYVLIFLLFILGVALFFSPKKIDYSKQTLEDIVSQKEIWREQLVKGKPDILWNTLKENYKENYHRHTVAHIFGELLFDTFGSDGISTCDESFSWGCYHAFFGRALADQGLDIFPKLSDACLKKSGGVDSGCQHGIGHGLMQYLGSEKLSEALGYCETINVNGDSCATGVFMEFNFPTAVEGLTATQEVREVDKSSPYEPCFQITSKFQEACFYELPRVWDRAYSSDFEVIGKLCQKISNPLLSQKCFAGTGGVVSLITDHNIENTIDQCQKMPNQNRINECLIAASWGFFSIEEHKSDAFEVCRDTPAEVQKKCAKQ